MNQPFGIALVILASIALIGLYVAFFVKKHYNQFPKKRKKRRAA